MAVHSLSEQMLAEKSAGGDRRVFAQLLKSVVHFPDDEFLYLVNGVLVITFGASFIKPVNSHPIHWLQSSSVPAQMPVTGRTTAGAVDIDIYPHHETVTRTRRWTWLWNWRWPLWPLLALLLLVLLLGL
jgi:hypothetical protein